MLKLAFATSKMFSEQRQELVRARRNFNEGIATEYRKQHKIFHNDFHHLYSTGLPFGASK